MVYKVVRPGNSAGWWLAVLDLRSDQAVLVTAEGRSIDDQVTWLDDGTLLSERRGRASGGE